MGKLICGAPTWSVEFEDRVLAHLRIVMIAKLRNAFVRASGQATS